MMTKYPLNNAFARTYANNGQHAEQVARFTFTGKIEKADNKPFTMGGDIGSLQVKSARATVCKGTDIRAHVEQDGASIYGYVVADFSVIYIMDAETYIRFVETFATRTTESAKNGLTVKLRLRYETNEMLRWLASN